MSEIEALRGAIERHMPELADQFLGSELPRSHFKALFIGQAEMLAEANFGQIRRSDSAGLNLLVRHLRDAMAALDSLGPAAVKALSDGEQSPRLPAGLPAAIRDITEAIERRLPAVQRSLRATGVADGTDWHATATAWAAGELWREQHDEGGLTFNDGSSPFGDFLVDVFEALGIVRNAAHYARLANDLREPAKIGA
ncbi:hypothetical protein H0I76_04980 [Limibaculum sp. M0105]|uniref:Uncharacterized protein n=1 Tax=Thermohalobaculum xanthum TaxID=2753746 RepID=A0A8J7SDN6_9RHOB|nr:hypothetical protein [Thermohalobaculum xanthum]MBK0398532.1 hypothetical protein [Thermohalobaculum xanthum]